MFQPFAPFPLSSLIRYLFFVGVVDTLERQPYALANCLNYERIVKTLDVSNIPIWAVEVLFCIWLFTA